MVLKVIGAGFGRTGTQSTYAALNRLGFRCYHMREVTSVKENKGHLDFWVKVARSPRGTQHDWEEVLADYTATVDNPGCCVWRELWAANPDAKILVTLHPGGPEAWYDSIVNTIYYTETLPYYGPLSLLTPFTRKFRTLTHRLVFNGMHKGVLNDKDKAIAQYKAHVDEVKALVPPEQLLIFTVSEGWEPLCDFLNVPVPDEPFPKINDRATIRKVIGQRIKTLYYVLAAYVAAAVAAVGLAWWALS